MSGSILILDQYSALGGAQRCLLDLLPAFVDAGYEVHLAAPGDGELFECARERGAEVHRLACGPYASGEKNWRDTIQFGSDLPRQASRVAALARQHAIDLIYVNGPRLLPGAAVGARGLPVVFHAHSVVTQRSAARLAQWAIRSARAHVIAACRFVLEPLGGSRSSVIYNGIAPVCGSKPLAARQRPWRIGVIGRIAPEKGQLEFVRAARVVIQQQQCEFVVCGEALFSDPGYARRVREEAAGLPVEFLGWRNDIGKILSDLDLLAIPSASVDATPRVILEAFSAGVPVVAFWSGGIPEIVEDGVTGMLCLPTVADLAATIVRVLAAEKGTLGGYSARAKAAFESRFSLARYQTQVLGVVEGVLCN